MEKIFSEILSMSVNSAWLIIAIIIVRAFMQKSPMYFRKILWILVGLRLVVPFSFQSDFSLVPQEVPQTADRVAQQVVTGAVEKSLSFSEVAPVLWTVVAVAFLVYGIISYIRLKIKIIDGVLVNGNVYQSEKIRSPFVCGFIKPKIYLPYGLDEITQRCVLKHEETHIKYADHIIKAIGFVVLCVHWFNPLVWVSYFLLCKDIELACDESVIKKYNETQCKEYAKALLDLGVSQVKLSACPIAFGEVSIKKRIKSVITYRKASRILVLASLCLCVGVSVCFMTEPETPLKEKAEQVQVPEETTEPVTEKATEPTTEPVTETVTEVQTEKFVPQTEYKAEPTVQVTEELYDDSLFENEDDGIEEGPINTINVVGSDLVDVPAPTSIYEGVSYNDFGSNSSVIGNKPSNSTQVPTFPSFNWDPAVTQAPTHNYGNTNYPHFEGNQWVYN